MRLEIQMAQYNLLCTAGRMHSPDEHFKKYLKVLTGKIINGSSSVTFENLLEGKYAMKCFVHDENTGFWQDEQRSYFSRRRELGFSNYESLGFSNRPSFDRVH
ncbi:MAG: DUF2141 domain-containing protein [Bacteroidales bacterium]|nr:DUF2141 domain-containing protein [Bacteroidales bacterium]